MDNNQISKFLEFAEKANKAGSEILLNHFSNILDLEKWKKSDKTKKKTQENHYNFDQISKKIL